MMDITYNVIVYFDVYSTFHYINRTIYLHTLGYIFINMQTYTHTYVCVCVCV